MLGNVLECSGGLLAVSPFKTLVGRIEGLRVEGRDANESTLNVIKNGDNGSVDSVLVLSTSNVAPSRIASEEGP